MYQKKLPIWNPFFWLWILYIKIYYMVYGRPKPPPTISDMTCIYNKKQHDRFIIALTEKASYNTNMDPRMYDRKSCVEVMSDKENEMEKKWKARILFENTPRGNIIMYYDPFKNGFVYYCDNSSIPYPILNAVVMKYVVLYRCIDLFIDENNTPEPSPLVQLIKDYETDQEKKPDTEKIAPPKSTAFAKFKKYTNTKSDKTETKDVKPVEEKMINSIVHGGKLCNFNFIQKMEKKTPGFRSTLLEGHTKITSWCDFKQKTQII